MSNDSNLRSLIRLLPPTRALKEQLEKALVMENFSGMGNPAIRSLNGLITSLVRLTDDPYIAALAPEIQDDTEEKEKVAMSLLIAAQLLGYLEGETGISNSGGSSGPTNINIMKAPNINLNDIQGVSNIGEIVEKALSTPPVEE